jgi:hypothetical protein
MTDGWFLTLSWPRETACLTSVERSLDSGLAPAYLVIFHPQAVNRRVSDDHLSMCSAGQVAANTAELRRKARNRNGWSVPGVKGVHLAYSNEKRGHH